MRRYFKLLFVLASAQFGRIDKNITTAWQTGLANEKQTQVLERQPPALLLEKMPMEISSAYHERFTHQFSIDSILVMQSTGLVSSVVFIAFERNLKSP